MFNWIIWGSIWKVEVILQSQSIMLLWKHSAQSRKELLKIFLSLSRHTIHVMYIVNQRSRNVWTVPARIWKIFLGIIELCVVIDNLSPWEACWYGHVSILTKLVLSGNLQQSLAYQVVANVCTVKMDWYPHVQNLLLVAMVSLHGFLTGILFSDVSI